jgi:adenylate cyclase
MASSEELAPRVTPGMTRKLAAILSADVAGYSRLMGEDEEATVRTVTAYRNVIATLVQQHYGRVVDSPGDNLLAEFASVVDAVQCAVAIQRELGLRNTALPLPRQMQFRLGINLGDVIPDGERIYGDGVNIAARLESLAEPGGICISGTVYDQVATKLPLTYKFLGQQPVKNIARPVRAYRVQAASGPSALQGRLRNWRGAGHPSRMALAVVGLLLILGGGVVGWQLFRQPSWPTAGAPAPQTAARALPARPSIAVLPFVNMSNDPGQEYFSDGMTEDLITDLARLAGLFVIARNSVFTYKGKAVKPEQVSRELGVRYMLEGSVRKANERLRITAQLIDATTGFHLWAERYDRDVHDIFAVQEEIARRITRALAVQLTLEEKANMERPYTNSAEAWKAFMRGAELYRQYTKESNAQARELFEEAIRLDPQFARAYANLAATYRMEWQNEWVPDLGTAEQRAVDLARRSVAMDSSLPYGHYQLGYLYLYRRQYDDAIAEAREAVRLGGPNYADGYAVLALVLTYSGQPKEAIELMEKAIGLDPKVASYRYHLGQAYYVWGQYERYEKGDEQKAKEYYQEAEIQLKRAMNITPNFRPSRSYLVAVYMETGREQEAREIWDAFPDMSRLINISQRRSHAPHKDSMIRDHYIDALRRAGSSGGTHGPGQGAP